MPERLDRRLTTILAADFAEHGRLMRADEDGDPTKSSSPTVLPKT
jgi:hypothetical protein